MLHQPKDSLPSRPHDEVPSFEVTSYGMKCHFPVAEIDGVTIAVLPCEEGGERLGLLLHPAPDVKFVKTALYYVSWAFRKPTGSGYGLKRLACLGSDDDNLRFRGKIVSTTWCDIYIAARPPTIGWTDGAHLLQGFVPDVAPTAFRIPRTLMQTLGALQFFPITMRVSWDPTSEDVIELSCQSTELMEAFRDDFGLCVGERGGDAGFEGAAEGGSVESGELPVVLGGIAARRAV